jgi:hypothetical protein
MNKNILELHGLLQKKGGSGGLLEVNLRYELIGMFEVVVPLEKSFTLVEL